MAASGRRSEPSPPGQAIWSGMFASLQAASAELAHTRVELEQRAAALQEAHDLSQQVVESMSEALFLMDRTGRVIQTNRPARVLLGCDDPDLLGRRLSDVFGSGDIPTTPWELLSRAPNGALPRIEVELRDAGGTTVPISVSCSPFRDRRGRIVGMLAVARDITARKQAEAALEHQALHDSLTNLPNRALIYDRIQQAILAGRRGDGAFALLVIDLDHFKEVNDTLGHQSGDVLLRQVGHRMSEALRESDTVARLGGDEFAVLLPGVDSEGAARAVDRLLAALESPFVIEEHSLTVGASIGIALHPNDGDAAETLFRRADVAMYVAKRSGGGYAFYDVDHDGHTIARLAMVGELRQAIEEGQLRLFYQPQVHLKTGQIVGVEALVRWQHPQRGMVPPDEFIPVAEQMGLIDALSRWVLEEAVSQSFAWRREGLDLSMAVNLSARNLQDLELPDMIGALLERCHVPPNALKLEITESAIMVDADRAMANLTRLRAMGLQTSIDDFGTGYSSLAYLKRLPVDQVKIDKSFVCHMATDPSDLAIVRTIVDLGHNLGLSVVAEGVEDQASMDRLAAIDCDLVQGYFLSRPQPAAELLERLKASPWGLRRLAEPATLQVEASPALGHQEPTAA